VKHLTRRLDGTIDVPQRSISQAIGITVVFFSSDICSGAFQNLQRLVYSPAVVGAVIHRRMIVQVLAVVDGGFFNIIDCRVDLTHGLLFIGTLRPISRPVFYQPASSAQIRQRVQVRRVLSWHLCMSIFREEAPSRKYG
jgi:hypothetical protein